MTRAALETVEKGRERKGEWTESTTISKYRLQWRPTK